jgi:hypothetical protein
MSSTRGDDDTWRRTHPEEIAMTNQHRPTTGDDDQARDDEARARAQQEQQPAGGTRDFETERAPGPGDDVQNSPIIINR